MVLTVVWEDFGRQKTDERRLDRDETTLRVKAKRITVNINDYKSADTFSCELDYKNFPFDPRCIKAVGVSIYIEDRGKLYQGGDLSPIEPSTENALFVGFADEQGITLDDNNRTVKMEGRDYTALLLDQPFLRGNLDLDLPLDKLIAGLLKEMPNTEKIKVVNKTGKELPSLAKYFPEWGESGGKLSGKRNTKQSDTYWEVIQDIINRAALIGYFEIDKFILTKPRNLYSQDLQYQFIYGKNLSSIDFKRKLARQKGFNLSLRSIDLVNKTVIEARIPEEATDEWLKEMNLPKKPIGVKKPQAAGSANAEGSTEGNEEVAPYMSFNLPNVATKELLIEKGQGVFEEISRQQIEGSFSTKEMAVRMGELEKPIEYNLLKLRVGSPVVISMEQGDMEGLSRQKGFEEKKKFLLARGYSEKVAAAFAERLNDLSRGIDKAMTFYTKSVEFSMDTEKGFDLKVEFLNFINIARATDGKA